MDLQRLIWLNIKHAVAGTRKSAYQVGVESGTGSDVLRQYLASDATRDMSFTRAAMIAKHLNVSLDDLTRADFSYEPANMNAGFAEAEAKPWTPPNKSQEIEIDTILQALCPDAKTPASYQLAKDMPGFSLNAGDVLVLDLAGGAINHQLIICRQACPETGEATTLVRRFLDPYLMGESSNVLPILLSDDEPTNIVGPVIAAFRPTL